MGDWAILLPRPGNSAGTLRLLDSMTEAGFEVWAPVTQKPITGKAETERTAMLPGFVFARANRLVDLHDLAHSPVQIYRVWDSEKRRMVVKGHPRFRIFRNDDGYSLAPERELAHLRREERRKKPRGQVRMFSVGDRVKLTDGAYSGLRGEVVEVRSKREVVISFPGIGFVRDATVPMWILLDDSCAASPVHVERAPNEQGHQFDRAA